MEPGFAQVAQTRPPFALAGALLGITVELGQDDDRDVQLLRERFEAGGDFRDFDLAIVLRAACWWSAGAEGNR